MSNWTDVGGHSFLPLKETLNNTVSMILSTRPPSSRSGLSMVNGDTATRGEWIFTFVAIPVICLPGIIGNIYSPLVLYRHGFKKTSNILLAALALADAIYLII